MLAHVVGNLPGKTRPGEYVLFSAHWDHLGRCKPDATGDDICNGAVDNATGVAALQIIFNIFRQKPIHTLFAEAKQRQVALLVRLPLASGLLGGKMTQETTFPANDHRNFNRDGQQFNVGETFAGLPFEKGVELADALKEFVPVGMTMAQMTLRWILDHDAVSVIIPGASSPAQATGNAAAAGLEKLPAELHAKIAEFYQTQVAQHIRGPY